MWCTSPALHHDHVLFVHRKDGAVTMNIPVEQVKNLKKEQDGGKKVLFAVFDELFVENLGSSVGKCVLAARDRC